MSSLAAETGEGVKQSAARCPALHESCRGGSMQHSAALKMLLVYALILKKCYTAMFLTTGFCETDTVLQIGYTL